jgi:hypothetical protein
MSAFVFAKTEEPKLKNESPKKEKVLTAKKNIEKLAEQKTIKILNVKQTSQMSDNCIIILALGPILAGPIPVDCLTSN